MADLAGVLLVHGAWVDASCWDAVVAKVERRGHHTVTVNLPLTTLADDAAALQAAIAAQDGPLLIVGHSYGGVVITEGADDPKVVGLAYVAAFAPDVGEAAATLIDRYPSSIMSAEIRLDDGRIGLTRKGVYIGFAQDLNEERKEALFLKQSPTGAGVLGTPVTNAAWTTRPNWYLVATQDHAIPPVLQRDLAAKLAATTSNVASSHVPMLSHPDAVAAFVCGAAGDCLK